MEYHHPSPIKQLNQNITIDLSQLLGKGSTGNVYKGESINHPKKSIAIKRIPLQDINNEVVSYLLQCELEALKATSLSYSKNVNNGSNNLNFEQPSLKS